MADPLPSEPIIEPALSLKHSLMRDTMLLSGSTVVAQVVYFVRGFLVARVLGPTVFGMWGVLALVLQYGTYGQFGVINALNREVPLLRGRGQPDRVETVRRVGFGSTLITSVILAIALLLATLWPGLGSPDLRAGLSIVALLIIAQQIHVFMFTVLKSDLSFKQASVLQFVLSVVSLILAVPAAIRWGLNGFLVAFLLSYAAALAYALSQPRCRIRPAISWPETRSLVRIGFPIMLLGLAYQFLTTGDQIIIASLLGTEQLGLYRLAAMAPFVLALIPAGASQTIYPRAAETYGRTGDERSLSSYLLQPSLALALLLPVAIGVLFLAWPLVIRLMLPNYCPGIPAAQVLTLVVFFTGLAQMPAVILNTTNRQGRYLLILCSFVLVNSAAVFGTLRLGGGIIDVAGVVLLVAALYAFTLYGYTLRQVVAARHGRTRTLVSMLWPFAYLGIAMAILGRLVSDWSSLPPLFGKTLLAELLWLVLAVPLVWVAERRTAIVSEALSAVRSRLHRKGGGR